MSSSPDEFTPEKWAAAYRALIDAVMTRWDRERAESPHTLLNYAPMKELRYCDPERWLKIQASANELLHRLIFEQTGYDQIRDGAPLLSHQEACALIWARAGLKIEERLPGFLEDKIKSGDTQFIENLSRAMNEGNRASAYTWKQVVAFLWATGLRDYWPLCFWSDQAIVSFLRHTNQAKLTLKQWRDFRRDSGLEEPLEIIVREFELVPSRDGGKPRLWVKCKPKKNPRLKD